MGIECLDAQVQVCTFWCLLDGETTPFSVEANPRWKLDQLVTAIYKRRRDLRLKHIGLVF